MNDARETEPKSLWRDTRGAVMVEYSILIGTIAIGSAIAFITVGVAFVNNFDVIRAMLLCVFP
jgi:Flp pilus assembly pilin Flp